MCTYEQRAKCQLCLAKRSSPHFQRLSFNLIREICSYLGAFTLIPCITDSKLSLYSLQGRLLLTTELPVSFACHSVVCLGEITELYVIAAESRSVYQINLDTIAPVLLPAMTSTRDFPGALYWNQVLYVFGGVDNHHNEKYSVQEHKWGETAQTAYNYMRRSPCRFKDEIYLSGGRNSSGSVEIYNPNRDQFTQIAGQESFYLERAVLLVTEKELLWLSSAGKVVHWDREALQVTVRVKAYRKKDAPWGRAQVREGSRLYWAKEGRGVFYYDCLRDQVCQLV